MKKNKPSRKRHTGSGKFERLLDIMAQLRSPEGGCPWDLRQKESDIGKYLLEEAYEVLDTIESGSSDGLREELGDLLFQIVFLARLSEEKGSFDMSGVLEEIARKMIRRHPHVFGNAKVRDAQDVKDRWDEIKKNVEKKEKTDHFMGTRIPRSLPALARTQRIVEAASRAGFGRVERKTLQKKCEDNLELFKKALSAGDHRKMSDRLGDLLFSIANLGHSSGVDAEEALRTATRRFADRLTRMENRRRTRDSTSRDISNKRLKRTGKG